MFRSAAASFFAWIFMSSSASFLAAQPSEPTNLASKQSVSGVPDEPDFSRDVQPIFASACGSCHGGVKQAAGISFVDPSTVLPPDGWVIDPGDPSGSELMLRLESPDPELRMPPPDEHPEGLTQSEIETVRRWIEQGANWTEHWSRTPLEKPQLPSTEDDWSRRPLDALVQAMHEGHGLTHASEAEPEQWLRRVYLDLTGLPPSLSELEHFSEQLRSAKNSSNREMIYDRQVDRLLASPRFGERWATVWMDLSRYADSKGYEKDPHRDMWPYRDWLIRAFNTDMPFDEFTIKQLAGDLLPQASYEDLVATAFHRNTQTNTEGGTDDEEFRTAAVIDRLNTTWTVWQATTFGCVQCHAHPYEPFKNQDFYTGLAIFNNSADCDLDSEFPTLPYVQDEQHRVQWVELNSQRQDLVRQLDQAGRQLVSAAEWSSLPVSGLETTSGTLRQDGNELRSSGTVSVGTTYQLQAKVELLTALKIHILPVSDSPLDWPEQGSVLSKLDVSVMTDDEQSERSVKLAEVIPDYRTGPYEPEQSLESGRQGFGGYPKLFGPRWAVITLAKPLKLEPGESLRIELHQKSSVTGGLSNHLRRFRMEYSTAPELADLHHTPERQRLRAELQNVEKHLDEIKGPALPIIQQRQPRGERPTHRFVRGNFLEKAEVVEPGLPSIFAEKTDLPVSGRLEFARWLVSEDNPLAARVWANRVWSELFGVGIVETVEDFGASGASPVNQPLLDHLAYTLQHRFSWHLKPLLKSIVLSSTYRQDSRRKSQGVSSDPQNRWLVRGPRTRLSAEMVRDQALLASGRLDASIGGPSVMPPQPDGVWQQAYSSSKWENAEGGERFRRGLYTYWKRTSPYPGFVMFDAPTRDVCSPRRLTTNTPLQALVTLNSRVYTELANALAERIQSERTGLKQMLVAMFRSVTSRRPEQVDIQHLLALYHSIASEVAERSEANVSDLGASGQGQASAGQAVKGPGKAEVESVDPKALSLVALAILNSDWALTK